MNEYKNVNIYDQNTEGEGICRIDNIVTFVPFTLKNEIVDIKVTNKNKNFNNGKLIKIIKESEERIKPNCKYYYECGGCNLMHQNYVDQLTYKKNKVMNIFKHISNLELNYIDIISENNFNYRNNITLNVKDNRIGFYKINTNEIVDIDECLISNENINKLIKEIKLFLKEFPNNNITRIDIRSYESTMVNIITKELKYKNKFIKYINADSIYINNEYVYGVEKVTEKLDKYEFDISPLSFFQKNTNMTIKLYSYIKSIINNDINVLDLYCGIGSIGIFIADKCKSVVGVEIVEDAIIDAKKNAELNNINNISFKCNKVEDISNNYKDIDTIIIDPPRIGLDKKAINNILNINPKEIIYVSCNPVTLSRDYNLLKEKYKLESIKLFDMFPNTYHIETVIKLRSIYD